MSKELKDYKVGNCVVDINDGRRGVVEKIFKESNQLRVHQEPLDLNIYCTYDPINGNLVKLREDSFYGRFK